MSINLSDKEKKMIVNYLDNLSPEDGNSKIKYSQVVEDLFKEYESAEIATEAVGNEFLEHISSRDPDMEVSVDQIKSDAARFGVDKYDHIKKRLDANKIKPSREESANNSISSPEKTKEGYSEGEKKAVKKVMMTHLMKEHKKDMDDMGLSQEEREKYLENHIDDILNNNPKSDAKPKPKAKGAGKQGLGQQGAEQQGAGQQGTEQSNAIAHLVNTIMGTVGSGIKATLQNTGKGLNYLKKLSGDSRTEKSGLNNAELSCKDLSEHLDELTVDIHSDIEALTDGTELSKADRKAKLDKLGKTLNKVSESSELLSMYKDSGNINDETKNTMRESTEKVEDAMDAFDHLGGSKKEKELKEQANTIRDFIIKLMKSIHSLFSRDKNSDVDAKPIKEKPKPKPNEDDLSNSP
jgi:hypothetical protein